MTVKYEDLPKGLYAAYNLLTSEVVGFVRAYDNMAAHGLAVKHYGANINVRSVIKVVEQE
ncbi:hypothetical protein BBD42_15345 [Paenibacillus sp. BIHB 4019]|uniref:Uncharacterized protein n=1 Tax=Paenibacillus sp. BIHB 4019 TaxID=1870819 RepID=A0A1B2DIZ1_9BACL|nr:hypothetical protein [Paenibacillus sp. BIHB 4019]ANY67687.1 hypothetical protein BBD42_15345 [Paenibacillus sp. BIHB 4019]